MANPTTNYGWPMPTSTDLVTDLPADFALFGQPVDTSLKALNPETTLGDIAYRSSTSNTNTRLGIGTSGQVLAVSGGVPAWTTTADVTPLTTKGDLFTFTTVDARIGVGANNTVLTADSAEASGLKWAAPSGGGFTMASFTPTYTNLTLGNGTVVAYSGYSGDIAVVQLQVTFGSTTSISGNVTFSNFPHTAKTLITDANNGYTATTGTAIFTNASYAYAGMALVGGTGGRAYYFDPPAPPTFTSIRPMATGASPITFTTGSVVQFSAFYWKV